MKYQIKNRVGEAIAEQEADSLKLAVEKLVASQADLRGADLRGVSLSEADLRGVSLSEADLRGVSLSEADLSEADLSWADLSEANLRWADLRAADLRAADLRAADLRAADLRAADLRWADLRAADLRAANLHGADLRGVSLSEADLRGVSLSEADLPVIPNIHQALLAAIQRDGCNLVMQAWHSCKTTHCRAGWITTLAGKAGKELDDKIGTNAAAALIYYASDPTLEHVPNFYATDEEAMADIVACAEREAVRAK